MTKATLLLVDDDEMSSQILSFILTDEDYEVDLATTGESALNKISNKKYNLVILDYVLPDMKGPEVAEKIKSINSTIKIILLSGFSHLDNECGKLYENVLLKPVSPDVIVKSIAELVGDTE